MKNYKSFEEIEYNLKRLNLERQIGIEKLKLVKQGFTEDLKPHKWVTTAAVFAGKYGVFMLIKKLIRKF